MKKIGLIITSLSLMCVFFAGCKKNSDTETTATQIKIENPNIEIAVEEIVEDKDILFFENQQEVVNDIKSTGYKQTTSSSFMMPILQNPTETSVTVQWFTEGETSDNRVTLYDNSGNKTADIEAISVKMSRLRGGKTEENCNDPSIDANIYKHVAIVENLPEYNGFMSERVKYSITSDNTSSDIYTLSAAAKPGTPMRILFTSDLQIKPMCAANLQKVFETVGHVDAIFCDGDQVDVIDRAFDWFYADNAFFRIFTGTAEDNVNGRTYYGAPLLQEAPIYTAIGNHDVMGVYDNSKDLSFQFNNPSTIEQARKLLDNSNEDYKEEEAQRFIADHSFNTISYEELFELPKNDLGNEKYYQTSIGDVGLITLYVSRVWRSPMVGISGKYSELPLSDENDFGGGDFIFEPISEDSPQIEFFKKAAASDMYQKSKYKITMFHSEAHSLGDNAVPAFTAPAKSEIKEPVTGINVTVYNYPISNDYIHNVIEPIAENAKTDLLLNAHSHLWNRFVTGSGMNVLQTSNVGNSYGAFVADSQRTSSPTALNSGDPFYGIKDAYDANNYPITGDLFGLSPVSPNVCQVPGNTSYVASNTLTVFSILNTDTGKIDSYYFDTENPDSEVVLFDSFDVKR